MRVLSHESTVWASADIPLCLTGVTELLVLDSYPGCLVLWTTGILLHLSLISFIIQVRNAEKMSLSSQRPDFQNCRTFSTLKLFSFSSVQWQTHENTGKCCTVWENYRDWVKFSSIYNVTVSFQLNPSLCLNKYLLFENEKATISLEGDFTDLTCVYLIIFFLNCTLINVTHLAFNNFNPQLDY